MESKISIVIPYYQREPGILSKALDSIFKQKSGWNIEVVVVDDESPVPAEEELRIFSSSCSYPVRVVHQANGGPAAARNRGLNELSADTKFVAFLDSDDQWADNHIERAVKALQCGYDFYFADLYHLGQTVGAFSRRGRIRPEEYPEVLPETGLHEYRGDMFDQILRGNIIGTPTVVYRFEKFQKLRFREEFVYAGEDYLFWMSLAKLTDKFVFSSRIECTCGKGVNVFSGSGWGTERSMIRLHYEMKYRKAVKSLFPLNEQQTRENDGVIKGYRQTFVRDILSRLSNQRLLDYQALRLQLRLDPQTFLFFLPIAIGIVIESAMGRKQ